MPFKYKAYNDLLINLGRIDFTIEVSELALRDFFDQMRNSGDEADFLKTKSTAHKIYVGYDRKCIEEITHRTTLSHIAFVYHSVESFFYDFQREFNQYCAEKWSFDSGTTKLTQCINFIKEKNPQALVEQLLFDVFNHYHQIRVKYSHPKTVSDKELKNKYSQAEKHSIDLKKRYRVNNSPKEFLDVDFEDYFLFTKISKDLCLNISSNCLPPVNQFVEIHKFNRFKKLSPVLRQKNAISLELKKLFSYLPEESVNFVDEIYSAL